VLHRWASLITGAFVVLVSVTGSILSFEDPAAPLQTVRLLHTHLLMDEPGEWIVTTTTISALVVVIIGVVLWWPDKIWKVRTSASWKRINFDLHHLLGIITSVIAIVMLVGALAFQLGEEEGKAATEALPNSLALDIHTGAFGGMTTTLIWSLASISLASQALTGFVMWWNRRKRGAASD
jgi:uncharacterized iron-regulated membrane protein